MKAYRVTLYARGVYQYHYELEDAVEAAGPLHFVGPEEGPEPGQPWEGFRDEEAHFVGDAPHARIELVELTLN